MVSSSTTRVQNLGSVSSILPLDWLRNVSLLLILKTVLKKNTNASYCVNCNLKAKSKSGSLSRNMMVVVMFIVVQLGLEVGCNATKFSSWIKETPFALSTGN